jgi:Reverse transcriptase (RNA-dependent DNA polymerase)
MEIPSGFAIPQSAGKVCKLKKSLYGLKQSLRAWFNRFRMIVCGMKYKQCSGEHTLFYKYFRRHIIILIVYVDDIVFTGDDEKEIL